jgi:hypothetical protein
MMNKGQMNTLDLGIYEVSHILGKADTTSTEVLQTAYMEARLIVHLLQGQKRDAGEELLYNRAFNVWSRIQGIINDRTGAAMLTEANS